MIGFNIHHYHNWIFDMDGTLTLACHDFGSIRHELGLPDNAPILETIARFPPDQAEMLHQKLFAIEMRLARIARPQPGIRQLLKQLTERDHRLGILTRNSLQIAYSTLESCALDVYFNKQDIVGRECCLPKPDPSGIQRLMRQWNAQTSHTLMIGDYWYDLQCGYNAGIDTIHFDVEGRFPWPQITSFRLSDMTKLLSLF